jgi:putative CocE/NonD family hydrolase
MQPLRTLSLLALLTLGHGPAAQDHSVYVPMRDGVRLAVDVHLPELAEGERVPALFELTRYWRSSENPRSGAPNPSTNPLDRFLLEAGYAVVKVDVRGSGASFGTRPMEYGPIEVRDGYDLVEWAVAEEWCDGNVGAYGTSYTGTTAELLAATGHPAVKAVIPGWSDFDLYRSPARPYGLHASSLIDTWGALVRSLDENDAGRFGALVRRVDADADGELRAEAVAGHAANLDVGPAVARATFRDTAIGPGGETLDHGSAQGWKREIEEAGVPMLVLASWLDSGTAAGALRRFRTFSNPQKLVILASNHGGGSHASPYTVGASPRPPVPPTEEQFGLRLDFLDHHLRGARNGVADWPAITYFNLGEEELVETDAWPPAGTERRRFHLAEGGALTTGAAAGPEGADVYTVDFGVTTGRSNVWATQLGTPVLRLDDRAAMDARMLCYTSAPLAEDLQVTGTPTVTLHVVSDHADGAFLVYLEDVDPSGRSRYVCEGGLRALHRRVVRDPEGLQELPYHSFLEEDAEPLVPGEPAVLAIELMPTSVRFRAGHRIRLAIAGADADSFARVPAQGTPELRVLRGAAQPSHLELPVQPLLR